MKITAIDMAIIALPKALFQDDEKISSVLVADDEMNMEIPPDSNNIYLYLQPGMSLTLNKSSESYLVADDDVARKLLVVKPLTKNDI